MVWAWLRKLFVVYSPKSETLAAAESRISTLEAELAQVQQLHDSQFQDNVRLIKAYDDSQLVVSQQKKMLEQATAEINRLKAREEPVKQFALKLVEAVGLIDEAVGNLPDDLRPLTPEEQEEEDDRLDGWDDDDEEEDDVIDPELRRELEEEGRKP